MCVVSLIAMTLSAQGGEEDKIPPGLLSLLLVAFNLGIFVTVISLQFSSVRVAIGAAPSVHSSVAPMPVASESAAEPDAPAASLQPLEQQVQAPQQQSPPSHQGTLQHPGGYHQSGAQGTYGGSLTSHTTEYEHEQPVGWELHDFGEDGAQQVERVGAHGGAKGSMATATGQGPAFTVGEQVQLCELADHHADINGLFGKVVKVYEGDKYAIKLADGRGPYKLKATHLTRFNATADNGEL